MECLVRWSEPAGMCFFATTGSGHILAMDGALEGGGHNLAPRPMELLLAGAGGCMAYDLVLILKRGRHEVRACELRLLAARAAEDPKVFTQIGFYFIVSGRSLPPEAVQRAVQLSREKYCSATAMLEKTAAISIEVAIVDTP